MIKIIPGIGKLYGDWKKFKSLMRKIFGGFPESRDPSKPGMFFMGIMETIPIEHSCLLVPGRYEASKPEQHTHTHTHPM